MHERDPILARWDALYERPTGLWNHLLVVGLDIAIGIGFIAFHTLNVEELREQYEGWACSLRHKVRYRTADRCLRKELPKD